MKLIMAIVKPFKLSDVSEALEALGVAGMTATEVKGHGRQKGRTEIDRRAEDEVQVWPKVKIEVVVEDDLEEKVVATVARSAATGKIGDDKILVVDVSSARRIRTGETGSAAL